MAKGKKQRKQGQDSDSEQELDNVEEIETTPVESAAGGKKGKKDRKKKKEAELEEAEKELEAIAAGEDPVADVKGEDEDGSKDTKSKKKKDKKKKNKADTPVDSDDETDFGSIVVCFSYHLFVVTSPRAMALPTTTTFFSSTLKEGGVVELALEQAPIPELKEDQVLVRIEASPLNPSDMPSIFQMADVRTAAKQAEVDGLARTTMQVAGGEGKPAGGKAPLGSECAGVVVAAGSSPAAQLLMGCVVGALSSGAGTYNEYTVVDAGKCLAMPEGVAPADAASWFVNPMTALCFVETMRKEGHKAIVHAAAASNLGVMLARICKADGIDLVCIVRKQEQVDILKAEGVKHIVNSTSPDFKAELTAAIKETGATIAFDPIAGGDLADTLLTCMEAALVSGGADGSAKSWYGSYTHKQLYQYGRLDYHPMVLKFTYGMQWSIGGWLLMARLPRMGPEVVMKMRQRVAAEMTTTFKTTYSSTISLADALDPDVIAKYSKQATGEKYLINPNMGK